MALWLQARSCFLINKTEKNAIIVIFVVVIVVVVVVIAVVVAIKTIVHVQYVGVF